MVTGELAGRAGITVMDASALLAVAVEQVNCPECDGALRGTPCPGATGCEARVRKVLRAARQKAARPARRRDSRRRHVPPPLIPGTHRVASTPMPRS
jgi:hypothetical protein